MVYPFGPRSDFGRPWRPVDFLALPDCPRCGYDLYAITYRMDTPDSTRNVSGYHLLVSCPDYTTQVHNPGGYIDDDRCILQRGLGCKRVLDL